ncbi:hypothetical protein Tco_1399724 [Tanacetum coccineum]
MSAKGNITKASHWSRHLKEDTRGCKETYTEGNFCTKSFAKEAQVLCHTDCHAGNPCAHLFDPMVKDWYPMIRDD